MRRYIKAIDVNMNAMPDAAMTLAVAALFAEGTTTIRDVASWRVKVKRRRKLHSSFSKALKAPARFDQKL